MIRNPNDDPLLKRIEALEQLLRANPLRNASFGSGGITVYDGGRIRFTEGGGIVIEGDGYIIIGGNLTGDGTFQWTGPWKFNNGDGEIAGNVKLTGDFDLTGKFIAGNIRIEDGKIYVGEGAAAIVIDGAASKILAGNMTIDPAEGGSVAFPGGAKLDADPGGGVRLTQGTNRVFVGDGLVSMQMGTRSIAISASGIQMTGADTIPSSLAGGAIPGTIWSDGTELFRVV
ncbi:hypothetical protein [Microbacterium sp. Root280D1]|uniref:hypothetical protein n=1 Tax=Microbacterium sp. Root280D1 TaxID=1736510 RepID=UPI0006FD55B8|nr:hypothetical protein [Microbacterium sp. Root280D1]KRD51968.1 hypothetical protein ASE34_08610 [Microbacterium sp. Root280D1]